MTRSEMRRSAEWLAEQLAKRTRWRAGSVEAVTPNAGSEDPKGVTAPPPRRPVPEGSPLPAPNDGHAEQKRGEHA